MWKMQIDDVMCDIFQHWHECWFLLMLFLWQLPINPEWNCLHSCKRTLATAVRVQTRNTMCCMPNSLCFWHLPEFFSNCMITHLYIIYHLNLFNPTWCLCSKAFYPPNTFKHMSKFTLMSNPIGLHCKVSYLCVCRIKAKVVWDSSG